MATTRSPTGMRLNTAVRTEKHNNIKVINTHFPSSVTPLPFCHRGAFVQGQLLNETNDLVAATKHEQGGEKIIIRHVAKQSLFFPWQYKDRLQEKTRSVLF